MAASLDGYINSQAAQGDNERALLGFTSPEDQKFVESLMRQCDAIVVGAESIRAAGQLWSLPESEKQPTWIVVSRKGLDKSHKFWQQDKIPRVLMTQQRITQISKAAKNISHWEYAGEDPSLFIYDKLKELQYKTVLLFGGGILNRYFYNKSLVDELYLTLCPFLVANPACSSLVQVPLDIPIELSLKSSQVKDNHVFLRYSIKK